MKENIEKNKAVVWLRKIGMPMLHIMRAFGETDKRNIVRVWKRDKLKYELPKMVGDNNKEQ